VTGIYEYTYAIPADFFINQNHPNPFNPITKIEYGLPEASYVQISIFDILGRQVAILIDNHQAPGYHKIIWNAGDLPSGIYFYRIQAEKFTETRKMLLLK